MSLVKDIISVMATKGNPMISATLIIRGYQTGKEEPFLAFFVKINNTWEIRNPATFSNQLVSDILHHPKVRLHTLF